MGLWKTCQELSEEGKAFVMVTLTNARGSIPQDEGAKIIITQEGRHSGTIGGGKIELAVIRKAQEILGKVQACPPETITWNLQTEIGMSCGGEVTLLFEYFHEAQWPIAIFGAGHVAQALIHVLKPMKCQITCIDPRQDWIEKLSGVRAIQHSSPKDEIKNLSPNTFFVVVTMGHDHDLPILMEIFKTYPQAPYVGCIGSEIKGKKLKKQLREAGVAENFIERLFVPMGLSIGTNDPHEIAISIAAQLIQVRDTK